MSAPRSKSPRAATIALFAIGGLFSYFVTFLVLISTFVAVTGLGSDAEPEQDAADAAPVVTTTTSVPTTTTTAPPPTYVVEKALSGDSVMVTDGTSSITVTISGIDAPDVAAAQCWAAESIAFATTTLVGENVVLSAGTSTANAVSALTLADGTDFAAAAIAAGLVRAAASATAAARSAESAAKLAGLGLWGAPCLGELVAPPPVQPLVPPPPRTTTQEPEPEPAPEPEPEPDVYYANCAAVRAAGAAPLHRGEPGYRSALDRDNDGIACDT